MFDEDHPFSFLSSLVRQDNATFTLSKYVYTADSLFDERESLSVAGKNLTDDWVSATIGSLRPDQELAFHSSVRVGSRNWHIPMIDFSLERQVSQDIFDRMSRYLPKTLMLNMAVYASG